MQTVQWPGNSYWPQWQKIIFRFFFAYCILIIEPWNIFSEIPGLNYITGFYSKGVDWIVNFANKSFFKTYDVLVPVNGSGDTSWAWTQIKLYLLLAILACIAWSLLDRKRDHYNRLAYWFRLVLRYFLIVNCFSYGFAKVFLQQMPFPNTSQLATPLGDFLPMRLSWMFMGYSSTYQFFSGLMEVLAGLFLLYRRTATFGTLFAAGVFLNVFAMNIGYDIPVKQYSLHLLSYSLVLLAFEYKRVFNFFLLNKTTEHGHVYDVRFPVKWMRIGRILLKLYIVVVSIGLPLYYRLQPQQPQAKNSVAAGIYNVKVFVRNGDTIPPASADTLRWQDMIFETNGSGSIKTADTTFRQLYGRGYFGSKADTAKQEITFNKRDWVFKTYELFTLNYSVIDSNHLILKGKMRNDSVYVELEKTKRSFQLAERQFHWLSEYNR